MTIAGSFDTPAPQQPDLGDLMGKKRQKVQWFPVDGLAWAGGEDGALQVGGGHQVATRARSHVQ